MSQLTTYPPSPGYSPPRKPRLQIMPSKPPPSGLSSTESTIPRKSRLQIVSSKTSLPSVEPTAGPTTIETKSPRSSTTQAVIHAPLGTIPTTKDVDHLCGVLSSLNMVSFDAQHILDVQTSPTSETKQEVQEEWKQPPGYSKHLVSTLSRIKTVKGERMMPYLNSKGYYVIGLTDDEGNRKTLQFHRLLAKTFVENPDPINKTQVDHINRKPGDNSLKNLRWVTPLENNLNRDCNIARAINPINQYDSATGELVKEWGAITHVCSENGNYSHHKLAEACRNESEYEGYTWGYVDAIEIPGEEWMSFGLGLGLPMIRVSSEGRVELPRVWNCRKRKTFGSEDEYRRVTICGTRFSVHQLVCRAFNPVEDMDQLFVNHIDEDKQNNSADNLEFVTPSQNILHTINMRGTAQTLRPVAQYNMEGVFIARFERLRDAANEHGMLCSQLFTVCAGRGSSAYNFRWKWIEKGDTEEDIQRVLPPMITGYESMKIPVAQYDLDGDLVRTFKSLIDASNSINPDANNSSHICRVCKGEVNYKTSCGYIWRYIAGDIADVPTKIDVEIRVHYAQYTLDGDLNQIFERLSDATKSLGLQASTGSSISSVCKGKFKYAYGYIWRYVVGDIEDVPRKIDPVVVYNGVAQYALNGDLIRIFARLVDAAESIGSKSCNTSVSVACAGNQKHAYGHLWRYVIGDVADVPQKIVPRTHVAQYTLEGDFVQIFESVGDARRDINHKGSSHISDVCRGKRTKACGYKWRYVIGDIAPEKIGPIVLPQSESLPLPLPLLSLPLHDE